MMRSERGFTLMELLVAVAILAIILVTVYGVLSRTLNAKNHAEERADLNASGREIVLKIADELEGALPPNTRQGIGFIGLPGKERVSTDAVQFATVIRREYGLNRNRGGRALVSYSLDQMPDRPNLFALRRTEELLTVAPASDETAEQADGADAVPPQTTTAVHLIDQVAALRFRYLDPTSGEWVESWDTTVDVTPTQPAVGLPGAVEITLFLTDTNNGVYDYGTIVDLPMAPFPTPTP